jgi:hypothetical protein
MVKLMQKKLEMFPNDLRQIVDARILKSLNERFLRQAVSSRWSHGTAALLDERRDDW